MNGAEILFIGVMGLGSVVAFAIVLVQIIAVWRAPAQDGCAACKREAAKGERYYAPWVPYWFCGSCYSELMRRVREDRRGGWL